MKILIRLALAGTLSLALSSVVVAQTLPSGSFWANDTASERTARPATVTQIFDRAICSSNNSIPARISGTWAGCLSVGTNGHVLPFLDSANTWSALQVFTLANGTATSVRSGAAGSYVAQTIGRTADELTVGITANVGNFLPGSIAGDASIISLGSLFVGISNGGSPLTSFSIDKTSGVLNFSLSPTFTSPSTTRTNLGLAAIAASGSATDLSTGTIACARLPALTGPVTTSAGSCATSIGANQVANTALAQALALTLKGNCTSATANVTDVQASGANQVMRVDASGSTCGWALLGGGNLSANSVGNTQLAQMPAATLKGNPGASTANGSDFTVAGLTARGAPDPANDKILILDNATGTFKYVTPALIAASGSSGVSSIDGRVGAYTLGSGLKSSAGPILDTVAPGGDCTGPRLAKTAAYTVVNADRFSAFRLGGTANYTVTLSAASGYDANFGICLYNEDTTRGKYISLTGSGTSFILYPNQWANIRNLNNVWTVDRPGRFNLFAQTVFTVDGTSGSDAASNDGMASSGSGAFATWQHAIDVVAANVDCNNQQLIIQGVSGQTYTGNITRLRDPVGCRTDYTSTRPILRGDPAASSFNNYIMACGANSTCVQGVNSTAGWQIEYFTFQATGTSNCIYGDNGSQMYAGNNQYYCQGGAHIISAFKSTVEVVANFTSYGPTGRVFQAVNGGQVITTGITITFAGSASQINFAFADAAGLILLGSGSFAGATSQSGNCIQAQNGGGVDRSGFGASMPCSTIANQVATSPGWLK